MSTPIAPITIPPEEIQFISIRSQGAGGQHVNKVSCAVHLRFDIRQSSLPDPVKEKLLHANDHRISTDGVIVIKAQQHRSLIKNKEEALRRLQEILTRATAIRKKRRKTSPSYGSIENRLQKKAKLGQTKKLRKKMPL